MPPLEGGGRGSTPRSLTMKKFKFKIGDKVKKVSGYKFNSVIVSVFRNTKGEVRLVAEHKDGLLHIFNENQMELRK